MRKSWVMLLVFVFVGMMAIIAYADSWNNRMVIVIDPDNGNVDGVYKVDTINTTDNSATFTGANKVQKVNYNSKRFGSEGHISGVSIIPDYTVIHTHGSPGCVTYTYNHWSWEVCSP